MDISDRQLTIIQYYQLVLSYFQPFLWIICHSQSHLDSRGLMFGLTPPELAQFHVPTPAIVSSEQRRL